MTATDESPRTYYDWLELKPPCTDEDVREAHRKLAAKYHPDATNDATTTDDFTAFSLAYETLRTEAGRKQYDYELKGAWRSGYRHVRPKVPESDGKGGFKTSGGLRSWRRPVYHGKLSWSFNIWPDTWDMTGGETAIVVATAVFAAVFMWVQAAVWPYIHPELFVISRFVFFADEFPPLWIALILGLAFMAVKIPLAARILTGSATVLLLIVWITAKLMIIYTKVVIRVTRWLTPIVRIRIEQHRGSSSV